jgi:HPt (histidine-containing phosphotransfer) domain-containing protein
MIKNEIEEIIVQKDSIEERVCNFKYLSDMMNGKKLLITGVMDVFLEQLPEELQSINKAVVKTDYATIKTFAHSMRSTVSIMGISVLGALLTEMEDLGASATGIEKIKELNQELNLICKQAIEETEKEKCNYI